MELPYQERPSSEPPTQHADKHKNFDRIPQLWRAGLDGEGGGGKGKEFISKEEVGENHKYI